MTSGFRTRCQLCARHGGAACSWHLTSRKNSCSATCALRQHQHAGTIIPYCVDFGIRVCDARWSAPYFLAALLRRHRSANQAIPRQGGGSLRQAPRISCVTRCGRINRDDVVRVERPRRQRPTTWASTRRQAPQSALQGLLRNLVDTRTLVRRRISRPLLKAVVSTS